MMKTTLGWHFLADNGTLAHDGRKVRRNITYRAKGPLELCKNGMHGSVRLIDALTYAPGSILTWCEFGGEMLKDRDKICAQWRRVIWKCDISRLLYEFARDVDEQALDPIGPHVDPRSRAAYNAAVHARSAAHSAAFKAAHSAALNAVRDEQNSELTRRVRKLMRSEKS